MPTIAASIAFAASCLMYGLVAQSDRRMHTSNVMDFPTGCVITTGIVFIVLLVLSVRQGIDNKNN